MSASGFDSRLFESPISQIDDLENHNFPFITFVFLHAGLTDAEGETGATTFASKGNQFH